VFARVDFGSLLSLFLAPLKIVNLSSFSLSAYDVIELHEFQAKTIQRAVH
jgi:hypothetical protein